MGPAAPSFQCRRRPREKEGSVLQVMTVRLTGQADGAVRRTTLGRGESSELWDCLWGVTQSWASGRAVGFGPRVFEPSAPHMDGFAQKWAKDDVVTPAELRSESSLSVNPCPFRLRPQKWRRLCCVEL